MGGSIQNMPSHEPPSLWTAFVGVFALGAMTKVVPTSSVGYNYLIGGMVGGIAGGYYNYDWENKTPSVLTGAGIGSALGAGAVAMRDERLPLAVRYAIAGVIGGTIGYIIQDTLPLYKWGYEYDKSILGFEADQFIGVVAGSALWITMAWYANKKMR